MDGGVKTKVHTAGLTIPLMATYKLSNRWNIKAGPYFSYLLSREFSGHVYEGYLREDDPTGPKVEFTGQQDLTFEGNAAALGTCPVTVTGTVEDGNADMTINVKVPTLQQTVKVTYSGVKQVAESGGN